MNWVWFVMTQSHALPGSDFPGPLEATIYVECQLAASNIRNAIDAAEAALCDKGYSVTHFSRCIGYDLDNWDFEEYPANSDLRRLCELLAENGDVEFGPFIYA